MYLIRKHTLLDYSFQHFKLIYAYFFEKARLVMLFFSRNLALPCLVFLKSGLAMLINFKLIKKHVDDLGFEMDLSGKAVIHKIMKTRFKKRKW